jgi:hypothetical protein
VAGPVGSSVGVLTGVAVGGAATVALQPAFEIPRQDAWSRNRNRILDLGLLARLVAEGGIDLSVAHADAHRQGYSDDKLDALVYLEQTVPGVSEALHLWRLGFISDTLMEHVLIKEGLDQRYTAAILRTKIEELIGLGDIAYAVVRGILPSPSYVPVPPPTKGTKVQRFPQVNIDPEELAAKIGFSPEALQIMVGRSGLSMAPGMAAQANFRNIIADDDYLMAIAEGDLRTEWAHAVKETSRQIPTSDQFVEAWLRGWITQQEAEDGAALHGMQPAYTDLIHKVKGRPVTFHEITTGLARGGTYPSTYDDIPEPYRKSIQEADIRPEWADIHYANRYLYPSAFVLRALAQAGDLGGQAAVEQVLLEIGWKPSFAQRVSTSWTTAAAGGDTHVAKAQTQLWSTTHRSYVAGEIDNPTATAAVEAAGAAAGSVPAVLALWTHERSLVRKQRSPAQIVKEWKAQVVNPATGAAYTHAEALADLLARGYSQHDATMLLEV